MSGSAPHMSWPCVARNRGDSCFFPAASGKGFFCISLYGLVTSLLLTLAGVTEALFLNKSHDTFNLFNIHFSEDLLNKLFSFVMKVIALQMTELLR